MTNGPYGGGTHTADVALVMPIFAGDDVIAFGISVTHWTEIGGKVLGSLSPDSTEIYPGGLQFPQLRLYRAGELNDGARRADPGERATAHDVASATSVPGSPRCASPRSASRGIVDRYGLAATLETFAAILAHGEAIARDALRRIPPGVYEAEDMIDGDGISEDPIPVRVRVTVTPDRFVADFTGTAPQTAGPINCARGALMSACKTVFKAITAPECALERRALRPAGGDRAGRHGLHRDPARADRLVLRSLGVRDRVDLEGAGSRPARAPLRRVLRLPLRLLHRRHAAGRRVLGAGHAAGWRLGRRGRCRWRERADRDDRRRHLQLSGGGHRARLSAGDGAQRPQRRGGRRRGTSPRWVRHDPRVSRPQSDRRLSARLARPVGTTALGQSMAATRERSTTSRSSAPDGEYDSWRPRYEPATCGRRSRPRRHRKRRRLG